MEPMSFPHAIGWLLSKLKSFLDTVGETDRFVNMAFNSIHPERLDRLVRR